MPALLDALAGIQETVLLYPPEDIGPIDVQRRNGVVGLLARDEAHAVALAKRYLSYFGGSRDDWAAPDPLLARHVVPENRLRAYDVHCAIESVVDVGSVRKGSARS